MMIESQPFVGSHGEDKRLLGMAGLMNSPSLKLSQIKSKQTSIEMEIKFSQVTSLGIR